MLASGMTSDLHCFTLVKNSVESGAHRIEMQWNVFYGGQGSSSDQPESWVLDVLSRLRYDQP